MAAVPLLQERLLVVTLLLIASHAVGAPQPRPPAVFSLTQVFTASHGIFPPAQPIPAACQAQLDAFCNSDALNGPQCLDPLRRQFGAQALPLVALFDRGVNHTDAAWGCYSRTAVTPLPHPHWDNHSRAYCTERPVARSANPINGSCFAGATNSTTKQYRPPLAHVVCSTDGNCSSLSLEWCGNECHRLGYSLAGVEAEHTCECGNVITSASQQVDIGECNRHCSGERTELCGARFRAFVYEAKPRVVPQSGTHLKTIYGKCGSRPTGEQAYFGFRIPAVAYDTKRDVLLAFAQGMFETCMFESDESDNHERRAGSFSLAADIVLKRSFDGGNTFQDLQVVFNSSAAGVGSAQDPTAVFERETGTTFLFFSTATTAGVRTSWRVASSTDGGEQWKIRDVSKECNPGGANSPAVFSGGHGTQLSNGRLVVPVYNLPAKGGGFGFGICFSDTRGRTWSSQGVVPYLPTEDPAESEIVELFSSPGAPLRLMSNFRIHASMVSGKMACGHGVSHCRWFAYSDTQGLTWENGTAVPEIPDPICKGGIARVDSLGALVQVNSRSLPPEGPATRVNQTVYLSLDNGKTWPQQHSVTVSADSGYATPVVIERQGERPIIVDLFDTHSDCSVKVARVDPTALLSEPPPLLRDADADADAGAGPVVP